MPFLPEKLVMTDCEMSGLYPEKDSLLQVAMVKLLLKDGKYTVQGEPLVIYLPFSGKPQSDFQKKFLSHIYEKCNTSDLGFPEAARQIENFLGKEYLGVAIPVGDCVPTDIEFLYKNKLLKRPGYAPDGSPIQGTLHYEFFDLNAVKTICRELLGYKFETPNQNPNIHDALVDCLNQIEELNLFLDILLRGAKPAPKKEKAMSKIDPQLKKDVLAMLKELNVPVSDGKVKLSDVEKAMTTAAWEKFPKGWDRDSAKKFWESLVGDVKHKRTKCMEKLKDSGLDTGAFCNSLYDLFEK